MERIEPLPSKAPFSKRFEEIVGEACESAAASQVARRFHLPETAVRAIDLRYLERWTGGAAIVWRDTRRIGLRHGARRRS